MTTKIGEILDGSPVREPEGLDREVPESRRPALRKLSSDVESLVEELSQGFDSRREVLKWCRRCIPRTLGEVDTEFYRRFSTQFRCGDEHRTLMSALLVEGARERSLDADAAEELRRRLAVTVLEPAYHRAFRELRSDATEYVDDSSGDESEHDPNRQRYIAMRPALDEFDKYQRVALEALLDGLESPDEIRRWGEILELATHGEIEGGFIERCYREPSSRALLTESDPTVAQTRARELFAAFHLLPAFNRGIRDLRNRSKEEPDAEKQEKEHTSI